MMKPLAFSLALCGMITVCQRFTCCTFSALRNSCEKTVLNVFSIKIKTTEKNTEKKTKPDQSFGSEKQAALELFEFVQQQLLRFVAGDGLERKLWFSSQPNSMILTFLQKKMLFWFTLMPKRLCALFNSRNLIYCIMGELIFSLAFYLTESKQGHGPPTGTGLLTQNPVHQDVKWFYFQIPLLF